MPPKAAYIRETFADFDVVLLLSGHSLISYQYSQGPAIPSQCHLIQLTGDGHQLDRVHDTAMYSPQALWTAAHERLPVTFVVMNNGEYNILKNYARNQAHYRSAGTNQFIGMDIRAPAIDFQALASSLGVASRRVERARDIAEAVEDGIRSGRPNLIELPIMA